MLKVLNMDVLGSDIDSMRSEYFRTMPVNIMKNPAKTIAESR